LFFDNLEESMWFAPRNKRWLFKLDDVPHKVELRQRMCQKITVTVDGEVIEWDQSLLDLLDFGGKFRFTLYSGAANSGDECSHECFLVINLLHIYLFVDGLDIEGGRRRWALSGGRVVIGTLVLLTVGLLLWGSILEVINTLRLGFP